MSLEKEIEDFFRKNANDIMIEYNHYHFKRCYKRLYKVIEKTASDFATKHTEKLSTELEQTKEKLKRCEEFIDLSIEADMLLTKLKDNG